MSHRFLIGIGVGIILLATFLFFFLDEKKNTLLQKSALIKLAAIPTVQIGTHLIPVEVVKNAASRQKGLSGKKTLAQDSGLLFIFPSPGVYGFWMKDMYFPIDIVWINNKKVVGIEKNVSIDFNPTSPKIFYPPSPVQYVLEINAGMAEKREIKPQDTVIFYNIE